MICLQGGCEGWFDFAFDSCGDIEVVFVRFDCEAVKGVIKGLDFGATPVVDAVSVGVGFTDTDSFIAGAEIGFDSFVIDEVFIGLGICFIWIKVSDRLGLFGSLFIIRDIPIMLS